MNDTRIDQWIREMSLEEKIAQLMFVMLTKEHWDENGELDLSKVDPWLGHGLGMVGINRFDEEPADYAKLVNQVQAHVMKRSGQAIPCIVFGEGLHGFYAKAATNFPQAIAMACSWDPGMVERVFAVVAREMRARGVTQAFTPVLDLGWDPRWGRIEETFGEDPFLVSRMGMAAVRGFQGEKGEFIPADKVISTLKHFAGHGWSEGGRNMAPVNITERLFRETALYPFEMAVKEAGAKSVMTAYHDIDGIPMTANRFYLTGVLRDDWGFDGLVVSDLGSVSRLITDHYMADSPAAAAQFALEAGTDMELVQTIACYPEILTLVREGKVSMETIDRSVRHVLEAKARLEIFEKPFVDEGKVTTLTHQLVDIELAKDAGRKSIVLLKNNGILPLTPGEHKRIALIGPNAAEIHTGSYSFEPRSGISLLEGLKDYTASFAELLYAEGCRITEGEASFWKDGEVIPADPGKDKERMREALEVASGVDLVILALGDNESTGREAWGPEHLGDRDDITLLGSQEELAREIIALGKPVVALLVNGRPLAVNYLDEYADAVLECWYLGEASGTVVAETLFGQNVPGGKMCVSVPKFIGQLPARYNHKKSRDREYLFVDSSPLYPFGHGLSYTTFEYSGLRIQPSTIGREEEIKVRLSVKVTNTGTREADEVVQLYVRDDYSSVTRPVKELKGFERVRIKPGESREVEFLLTKEHLEFYRQDMQRAVEPGTFTIMVGTSSVEHLDGVLSVEG